MKKLFSLLLSLGILLLSEQAIFAAYNPLDVPNNKFGIHVIDENGLNAAAELVNSNGGDWGYVTLVIREDERDLVRWQRVFDKMSELHLIPLVRIASSQGTKGWSQAQLADIDAWVEFFDSLTWVTANRYVIIGNEPNHQTEWDGEVNPEEYADYLFELSKELKNSSSNYFILPAGFDASAPSDARHLDEATYLTRMIDHNENVFEHVDGWTSHSYPNPAFAGKVDDTGRTSIQAYRWELELLRKLGIKKELPVFITETGWVTNKTTDEEISENYKRAFSEIWSDERVVAVTPFILDYPGEPFDIFSWKKPDGTYRSFYDTVKNIEKVQGSPVLEKENVSKNENKDFVYNLLHTFWQT